MNTHTSRYQKAVSALLLAYERGDLGHDPQKNCAVTHLLGGKKEWIDAIHPILGTVDHETKMRNPRTFAQGLSQINESEFSIEEIIEIEAHFSGRKTDGQGNRFSTYDENTDPEGSLGLSAVFQMLPLLDNNNSFNSQPVKVARKVFA